MKQKGNEKRIDLEKILEEGSIIRIKPEGYSMYPMFIPGRDEALIEKADPAALKRGDVVLYRRDHGILVLHRIWKYKKEGFYMVGDNQSQIEGPIRLDQVKGILVRFIRNGKEISVSNPLYKMTSALWLRLRPFRPILSKIASRIKKIYIHPQH